MKKIKGQIRQGDVLLHPVNGIPKGAVEVTKHGPRGIVLAEGEKTGHAHTLSPKHCKEYVLSGVRYIKVNEETELVHGKVGQKRTEHPDHYWETVKVGVYEYKPQYEEFMDEVRQVMD